MSAPIKDKQTLIRLAWLTELRRQGHRKCEGFYSEELGRVCALGLLSEIHFGEPLWFEEGTIGALAGLNSWQSSDVAARNDGSLMPGNYLGCYTKHTFAEIADIVAGWFKQ